MDSRKLTRPRDKFQSGESVIVLYQGKYNGRLGRFVGTRADPNWVDIEEKPGVVRAHPLDWVRRIDDRFDGADIGPSLSPPTGDLIETAPTG
jgi:hypothetical protein